MSRQDVVAGAYTMLCCPAYLHFLERNRQHPDHIRPNRLVKPGKGKRSTKGAHKNLNEYARAAQLKYVTVERATPASLSQTDREENMSKSGTPAEKPKNNIDTTRGCKKA